MSMDVSHQRSRAFCHPVKVSKFVNANEWLILVVESVFLGRQRTFDNNNNNNPVIIDYFN